MTSPAKAKGTRWETASHRALAAFFLGRFGLVPRKPHAEGHDDAGDRHVGPYVVQAKDWASWEKAMREGLDGAERQRVIAGLPYAVALVKRARRAPGDAYAVQRLSTWARVLLRLMRAEALLELHAPDVYRGHMEAVEAESADPFPRA